MYEMCLVYHVKSGNLLKITDGIICHQVNCLGLMGTGISLQIRNKYPIVFDQYRNLVTEQGCDLGQIQVVKVTKLLSVANIFGQKGIGTGIRRTNYETVDKAFGSLKDYIVLNELDSNKVYIPEKMGCNLGGGNWDVYLSIVVQYFPNINIMRYK